MASLPVAAALIHRLELVLGGAADGADPFRGDFIKGGVGGDMVVRITLGRVIDVTTDLALVLFHDFLLGSKDSSRTRPRIRSGPAANESR
jgi:hypothetical protein